MAFKLRTTGKDSYGSGACYAGVVPFEHTSGKSIRAKPKVHYLANKKLKKQLHMCALSAIKHDPELKLYFNKKVEE